MLAFPLAKAAARLLSVHSTSAAERNWSARDPLLGLVKLVAIKGYSNPMGNSGLNAAEGNMFGCFYIWP